jgi:serine/threonine-protein kinase
LGKVADETICPKCGALNPLGTVFCGKCGTGLASAVSEGEAPDPLIGTFVGDRFLVRRKLGEGGMGVVYEAEQTAIDRMVALKVLHPHLTDESLYARFRNEAAACSRLNHPNTITVYDFGKSSSGSLYIAMEFIQGTSLDDEIARKGALDWRRACRIGMQICGSLQDAHSHGIVHRDLKPENVMLTERGGEGDVVKVLDFGIAKIVEDDGQDQRKALTKTGMVFGTPQYMSPEQIRGEKVDARSDIYSTGVILYQMLCGVLPFKAETPMGLLTKHLLDVPPPFAQAVPGAQIPAELERAVMQALAKDPGERPATMRELAMWLSEISGLAAGQTILGPAVGSGVPATAAMPAAGTGVGTGAPLPKTKVQEGLPAVAPAPGRGRGGMIAGIVVGAVLLLGGGAAAWWFLLGPGRGPAPQPQVPPVAQIVPAEVPPVIPPVVPPTVPVAGAGQGDSAETVGAGALPPLPAVPLDDEPEKGGTKTGGSGGGIKIPKPKGTACGFSGSQNTVAAAVLGNLKLGESALKACATSDGEHETAFSFQVPAGSTELEKIAVTKSAGMDGCLRQLLQRKLAVSDPAAHGGKATFRLERQKGVVTGCAVNVTAAATRKVIAPTKPAPEKKQEDPPAKKETKTGGLRIIKQP